jgi:hypothetical protein
MMDRGRKLIGVGLLTLALAFGLAGCAQDTAGSGGANGNGQLFTNDGRVIDAGHGAPAEGGSHSAEGGTEGGATAPEGGSHGTGGSEGAPTATPGH